MGSVRLSARASERFSGRAMGYTLNYYNPIIMAL